MDRCDAHERTTRPSIMTPFTKLKLYLSFLIIVGGYCAMTDNPWPAAAALLITPLANHVWNRKAL
jgi:hypothetical protein